MSLVLFAESLQGHSIGVKNCLLLSSSTKRPSFRAQESQDFLRKLHQWRLFVALTSNCLQRGSVWILFRASIVMKNNQWLSSGNHEQLSFICKIHLPIIRHQPAHKLLQQLKHQVPPHCALCSLLDSPSMQKLSSVLRDQYLNLHHSDLSITCEYWLQLLCSWLHRLPSLEPSSWQAPAP